MGYFCYMTKAGYELQAKLFADGGDFEITRVMVGSGRHPEGADPSAFADLAAPVAQATSTKPLRRGCEVDLIVEYRSDLNGGVENSDSNNYSGSTIDAWLNGDYKNLLDADIQAALGATRFYYTVHIKNRSQDTYEPGILQQPVFLLSATELRRSYSFILSAFLKNLVALQPFNLGMVRLGEYKLLKRIGGIRPSPLASRATSNSIFPCST